MSKRSFCSICKKVINNRQGFAVANVLFCLSCGRRFVNTILELIDKLEAEQSESVDFVRAIELGDNDV